MCQQNDFVEVEVIIKLSDFDYVAEFVQVDRCIAPIVSALSDSGIATVACCCGHGRHRGSIILADGREMLVVPDFKTARIMDRLVEVVRMDIPSYKERYEDIAKSSWFHDMYGNHSLGESIEIE